MIWLFPPLIIINYALVYFIQAITTAICVVYKYSMSCQANGERGGVGVGGEGRVGGSTASSPSWSGAEMEMPTCCLQFERHLLAQDDRKNTITMQCNAKSQHKSLTSSNRLAMAHFQPLYVIVTILFITR